ncbi:MAG: tetratricopeptide repeat protein [Myxococcota bacterium]
MQTRHRSFTCLITLGFVASLTVAGCGGDKAAEKGNATAQPVQRAYDPVQLGRQIRALDALVARGERLAKDDLVLRASTDPEAPTARFLKAYGNEDRRLAWKELDALRKSLPKSPLGYLGMLCVYVEWKILEEAQKSYDQVLQLDAQLAVAHARMANLHAGKGNAAKARELYGMALKLDPQDGDALAGLARLARAEGKNEEALGLYTRAVTAWPESLPVARERAELLEAMGRRKEAAEGFLASARIDPRKYQALLRAAALLAQESDRAGAEKVYQEALALNPKDASLLITLGQLAGERGDKEAQLGYFARAVEDKPDDLDVQRVLAFGYLERGESTGAERHLQEVIRLAPEDQAAHLALARMHAQGNKYREALEHYELASRPNPLDDTARGELLTLRQKLLLSDKPVTGKDVNKTFGAALKVIIAAYEARLTESPTLAGSVTVEVDVAEDGSVKDVRLKEDTLKDEILLANIYFTVKGARFPAGKKARYSYPISFAPPKAK